MGPRLAGTPHQRGLHAVAQLLLCSTCLLPAIPPLPAAAISTPTACCSHFLAFLPAAATAAAPHGSQLQHRTVGLRRNPSPAPMILGWLHVVPARLVCFLLHREVLVMQLGQGVGAANCRGGEWHEKLSSGRRKGESGSE